MYIDWNNIKTVLLDMDGTLLDLHFDTHYWLSHLPRRYAEIHAIPEDAAHQHLSQLFAEKRGTLDWYCLEFWQDKLQVDILSLKKEVSHLIAVRQDSIDFLCHLKDIRKQRVLVTNAHRDSLDLKLQHTRIQQYLDAIYSSHDFGHPKESPSFWQALQNTHPFNPEHTLFIDDSLDVLHAAQRYGIKHTLCIAQPDSQQPPKTITTMDAIDNFYQIM